MKHISTLLIFFSLQINTATAADYYDYSSLAYTNGSHNNDVIRIASNGKASINGLYGAPYGGCEDKKWICSFSLNLNFALPDENLETQKSWEYKGYKHKIIQELELEYFGRKIKTLLIEVISQFNQTDNYIFYSKKYGIAGFTVFYADSDSDGSAARTYFSQSKYGYGSDR